ncbi:hypothetical protein DL93DRAFT_1689297 [Clavulina sp. PMI_390]|nr:hypothetical protein DL93DRAFT_1689297 [Clavulina sp. PMI_390]
MGATSTSPLPSSSPSLEKSTHHIARRKSTFSRPTFAPSSTPGLSGSASSETKPSPPPKRHMLSTWHRDPSKTHFSFTSLGWLANFLIDHSNIHGGTQAPGEKLSVHSAIAQHIFVLPKALIPVVIQYISMTYFNLSWSLPFAFVFYSTVATLFSFVMLFHFKAITAKHGFLDASHSRDGIPDSKLNGTLIFLGLTLSGRALVGGLLAYDRFEIPSFSIWDPIHIFVFHCVLDFYFYIYHRAMHEVPWLWKYHKTHHLAKHPIPLLSIFADPEQDFCDIFVIPWLATMTYPLRFHAWWVSAVYILYIEAGSHLGARIYWSPPITGPILYWFNMELVLEDHDLHHRLGWRTSSNYGKQTRIWDTVFGTKRERLEVKREDVDWSRCKRFAWNDLDGR